MDKIIISSERKIYLKNKKIANRLVLFTQIAIFVFFIALWEFLARNNIIDSFITSQPSRIWNKFMNLRTNNLVEHISVTVYETLVGFLLGTGIGILIAIILWWSRFLSRVAEPYLVVLNSLPKVALRTNYNNMGRSWDLSHYCYGNCYFTNCYNTRKLKWIFKNR